MVTFRRTTHVLIRERERTLSYGKNKTEKKVCAYLLGAVVGGVLLHDDAVHLHHVRLHEILVAQLFLADLAVATTAKN